MSSSIGFDPRAARIESQPTEPALPERALSFSVLEDIFSRMRAQPKFPRWSPEMVQDRRRPLRPVTRETAVRASVLIPFTGEQQVSIVLTQRTEDLSSHAGQVSFPGGRAEASDPSEEHTALREAHEEIGVHPQCIAVWGRLPDYMTATGFLVTPVLGRITAASGYVRDQREVADVFEVPLSFLMNPANHQVRVVPAHESPTGELIRFYAMPYLSPAHAHREFFIWGATAAMLRNLYHLLSAAMREY
ncbi:MAG: CoA pyrophosphatase [Burkholderiaceae bacterium]|nr:CoA pyrophosphatase [Burkholderiaceae bacterium]